MSRRLSVALGGLALTGGAIAAALALGTGGGGAVAPAVPPPPRDAVTATAAIEPAQALFADRLAAEVVVTVDNSRVDPESVLVGPRFAPFDRIGPARVVQEHSAATTVLRFRFALQCVARPCAPKGRTVDIALPPATVTWSFRDSSEDGRDTVEWPTVTIGSRVDPAARANPVPQLSSLAPGPVSYGTSPTLLRWLFLGGAVLLVLVAGIGGSLLVLRMRRPAPAAVAEPERFTLEDALAVVERTARDGSPTDRRTALDALAELAAERPVDGLAARARRLAWSRRSPQPDELEELAADLRRALAEGE